MAKITTNESTIIIRIQNELLIIQSDKKLKKSQKRFLSKSDKSVPAIVQEVTLSKHFADK